MRDRAEMDDVLPLPGVPEHGRSQQALQAMQSTNPTPLDDELSPKLVHLIRSTYKMMGRQGVHGLNLQDVADDAGVSKATLFYYFASKETLILTTMRWLLARGDLGVCGDAGQALTGTASKLIFSRPDQLARARGKLAMAALAVAGAGSTSGSDRC